MYIYVYGSSHNNTQQIIMQVLWGGRWQPNSAAGAGEEMEQLFSYLSRFNFTTKYMNAAGM